MSAPAPEPNPADPGLPAPLDGVRIIDLSTYVAGPSGAMTLAQLGAEVIRVDPPGGATDTRRLPRSPAGVSLYWAGLNKAKRSVEIDTLTAEGQELVGALVAAPGNGGGILLTNAVGQAWLSYEAMRTHRPDLILVHITGRSDGKPAVDYTVNCEVGLPDITGPSDVSRPVNHVLPAWDLHRAPRRRRHPRRRAHAPAHRGRSARHRRPRRRGRGHDGPPRVRRRCRDLAINGRSRLRDGNYLYGSFGCDFPTSDGQRVMIVALTERHWHKLVELTGTKATIAALEQSLDVDLDTEEGRYEYREVLEALLRPWFRSRPYAEVTAGLDAARVLWGPYRSIENFVTDPTSPLHRSDLMVEVDQPGVGTFPAPRPVLGFSGWDDKTPTPAPVLGRDTDDVLRDLLALSDADLADLRDRSIIGGGTR